MNETKSTNESISTSGIATIIAQLQDAWNGDPWYGRNITSLLEEVTEDIVFEKLNDQHSILELVWHMITWREFILDRLHPQKDLRYFEDIDWRPLDHTDKSLWQKGIQRLTETQQELVTAFEKLDDSLLHKQVAGKTYDFNKLLFGIVQHDIYHTGQIAFITKALSNPLSKKTQ